MNSRSFPAAPLASPQYGLPRAVVLVALITALALGGCSSKADNVAPASATTPHEVTMTAAQRAHIRLYRVAASDYRRTIDTTGVVDFDNDRATSVLAPFSGPVARLLVAPGDKVKKGQPLAMVDSPDFAQAIGAYRKALVTARTARRLADMDQDLVAHDGVAQREEQQAQTDAASAEADRDAALQALVGLNVDPQTLKDIQSGRPVAHMDGIIRSPVTGTVVQKLITPGQLLQAGSTPCFTVADLSQVWVLAQISATELASVHVGDAAEVVAGDGTGSLSGTVANIAALVDPDTRAVAARVVVDNPHELLKKQMYVSVRIHSHQSSHGLLVPVSAILRDDENLPFVYVTQHDGSFARRPVTLGYRLADRYDISAGLRSGEQIVVDGGIFVQFMQNQ
ncbi:MAG TPA: efflux RND transporter periplasmic adaptor subunit [Rhodanobacter sp.]|nr:efflux RND transporter periplasmic adaptor subunit [Rhodanobacter sp.]